MTARVENLKASIRNEVALQNAQELMEVDGSDSFVVVRSPCLRMPESQQQMLPEVRPEAWYLPFQLGRGTTMCMHL